MSCIKAITNDCICFYIDGNIKYKISVKYSKLEVIICLPQLGGMLLLLHQKGASVFVMYDCYFL